MHTLSMEYEKGDNRLKFYYKDVLTKSEIIILSMSAIINVVFIVGHIKQMQSKLGSATMIMIMSDDLMMIEKRCDKLIEKLSENA